jgi:hypothetical protein
MSFWKSLFGGKAAAGDAEPTLGEAVEYNGFVIRAAPIAESGRYLTAGVIEKEVAGVRKTHRFIRADTFASRDEAVTFSVGKARQIIDLMGERIFD